MPIYKEGKAVLNPTCPHCGGKHLGQRFDDCPYVRIVNAPPGEYTAEQVVNSRKWLVEYAKEKAACQL